MKRPEETMRALSREELEQMLQNDFLMASSCDAEQVVQVVEELMAREGHAIAHENKLGVGFHLNIDIAAA